MTVENLIDDFKKFSVKVKKYKHFLDSSLSRLSTNLNSKMKKEKKTGKRQI